MTLVEALNKGEHVLISFVDVQRDMQWSVTFVQMSNFAQFVSPIAGELEYVGEPTPEQPFRFYKAIFVSQTPPNEEKKEEEEPVILKCEA